MNMLPVHGEDMSGQLPPIAHQPWVPRLARRRLRALAMEGGGGGGGMHQHWLGLHRLLR